MARPINRLSARAVAASVGPKYHADGGGLYLLVTEAGTRSWVYRYQLRKRRREMGLGPYPVVGLQEARQRATDARRKVEAGEDPIEARKAAAAPGKTFGEATAEFINSVREEWKNGAQEAQWLQSLRDHGPPAAMPVAEVDTPTVLEALRKIWSTKTETATRVRGRIERIIDWATVQKLRSGENPARWRGHLDKLLPRPMKLKRRGHHAAMPYTDLPAFMATLAAGDSRTRLALCFTILTAARTEEVLGMSWGEVDLEAATWKIPAERMKAGKEHIVPLAPAAAAILSGLPRGKPPFRLSENTMLYLLRRDPPKGLGRPYTVHGFRSAFSDWAHEQTAHENYVIEMALAHAIKDKSEAAYRRGVLLAKRRQLMEDWSRYCYAVSGS